jgi:Transposase
VGQKSRRKPTPVNKSVPVEIVDAEHELVIERAAAVDVAKTSGKVCVRLTGKSGRRFSRVWDVPARTGAITELAEQLRELGIEKVTVESTSDYWRIWYYLLEDQGLDVQLVNARDVKNVPGRPKTDLLTELPPAVGGGCVPGGVGLARFAARDGRWRTAAGFGGAGGAGSGCFGGHRRSLPALSAG